MVKSVINKASLVLIYRYRYVFTFQNVSFKPEVVSISMSKLSNQYFANQLVNDHNKKESPQILPDVLGISDPYIGDSLKYLFSLVEFNV